MRCAGKLKAKVPQGAYSCMVRHLRFYTAFIKDCHVTPAGLALGDVALSPVSTGADIAGGSVPRVCLRPLLLAGMHG